MVATPIPKLDKKAQVVIMGAGFETGQEFRFLVTTMDGVGLTLIMLLTQNR